MKKRDFDGREECTGAKDFLDDIGGGAVVATEDGEQIRGDHLHLSAESHTLISNTCKKVRTQREKKKKKMREPERERRCERKEK